MAILTYPGVYVEEIPSGVRPIAAAGTSTPAFVGLTEMGPTTEARRVTSWTEYNKLYGAFISGSYMAQSVFQFFNNGGQQCYIVRVTLPNLVAADATIMNQLGKANSLIFTALYPGAWGNSLFLTIESGTNTPGSEFKISIRKITDGIPSDLARIAPLEVYDNVTMNPNADNYIEKVVANSSLITVEVKDTTSLQAGYHSGSPLLITVPNPNPNNLTPATSPLAFAPNGSFLINLNGDGYQQTTLSGFVANTTTLTDVATAIQNAVTALKPQKTSTPPAAFSSFTCKAMVTGDKTAAYLLLTSGTADLASSVRVQPAPSNDITVLLKVGPSGGWYADAFAGRSPMLANVIQLGDNVTNATGPVTAVTPGTDGTGALTEQTYANQFPLLDNKTDFSLLAAPGIGTPPMFDLGVAYCENRPLRDVFYIGEMADHDNTPDEAQTFRALITKPNSYGALYFPWISALDPSGKTAQPVTLPPSGYIAGLYGRIDSTRGVWKAPGGTEATLSGAVGLTIDLTDTQQGNLNPQGVNCIRRFTSAGIVAWGARTVTSDPEYLYVPVRRIAIMLRVSIYRGIQWAVFEPNDTELWSQLRLNITAFMMTLYRQGAFQGSTPSDAFFVKCDAETTTQDDINLGIVNVLIGFAPLKPAEFVVVKISQKAGQAS